MAREHMQVQVDDQVKRKFKAACVMRGLSMSEVVEGLLKVWLDKVEIEEKNTATVSTPKTKQTRKKSV